MKRLLLTAAIALSILSTPLFAEAITERTPWDFEVKFGGTFGTVNQQGQAPGSSILPGVSNSRVCPSVSASISMSHGTLRSRAKFNSSPTSRFFRLRGSPSMGFSPIIFWWLAPYGGGLRPVHRSYSRPV